MQNKYGTYTTQQFEGYKKRLHNMIHWFLIYVDEENFEDLSRYFDIVQIKLIGMNSLLNNPPEIVEIMGLLESAHIEFEKDNFNHKRYRKLILDAHELINRIGEDA